MTATIVFQPIKPEKLKEDRIRLELLNALRAEGASIRRLQRQTVQTWKRKPRFKTSKISLAGGIASVVTTTDDERYRWTDKGTRAHIIRARNVPRLRFRTGFSPKTKPGILKSFPGRRFGSIARPRAVRHPGTKPRGFSKAIALRRQRLFSKRMEKAMAKGANKLY